MPGNKHDILAEDLMPCISWLLAWVFLMPFSTCWSRGVSWDVKSENLYDSRKVDFYSRVREN